MEERDIYMLKRETRKKSDAGKRRKEKKEGRKGRKKRKEKKKGDMLDMSFFCVCIQSPVAWKTLLMCSTVLGDATFSLLGSKVKQRKEQGELLNTDLAWVMHSSSTLVFQPSPNARLDHIQVGEE